MSAKNRDRCNRWRSKTVSFRVSLEENEQLNTFVKASCAELQRIKKAGDCTPEFLDILNQIIQILKDMKEDTYD